jgi:tRNA(Ile)-lysidine synthase
MLRGEEAMLDEKYASELCNELGVPLAVERRNIEAIAKQRKLSLEEAGREERYSLFERYSVEFGAGKTAVAHNRNDQAETVLMNLIRGAGLQGLKGIDYRRGSVIRPLLDISRSRIEEYCFENMLSPRIDSSNLKNIYMRNKIRLKLIPEIDELFDCDIVDGISRMSHIVRENLNYIDGEVRRAYALCCRRNPGGEVVLDTDILGSLHTALKKGIVREIIKELKGNYRNIGLEHVQSVLDLAERGQTGSLLELPGKLNARKSYNALIFSFSAIPEESEASFGMPLVIGGITQLPGQRGALETEVLDAGSQACHELKGSIRQKAFKKSNSHAEQFFDYDRLKEGITKQCGINIRSRLSGDIFCPLGSGGTKKLKEYFIDSKIPREIRHEIPLIALGNEIIWVIGYRTSEKFKISENTKSILRIKYSTERLLK